MLALLLAACLPHPAPIPVGAVPEDAAVVAIVGEASGHEPVSDILAEADVVVVMATGRPSRALAQWQGAPVAGVAILPLVGEETARGRRFADFQAAFPGASAYGWVDVGGVRLVWLDTSGDPVRGAEQMYWLPRAMAGDAPKIVLVPLGPETDSLLAASADYAPAAGPAVAWVTVGVVAEARIPLVPYAEARLRAGPLAGGWWRLELTGDVGVEGIDSLGNTVLAYRWTAKEGWQVVQDAQ